MTTVVSPRPSITLSSRRTSTSTEATERGGAGTGSLRRNRAALRDYYNLKSNADSAPPTESPHVELVESESDLDKEGFDPQQHVDLLLASEGLEAITRAEARAVSEIKGLDGEKKALVYDNYSKLISATDTIKKMRGNMDPLDPATTTLMPAFTHISETAAELGQSLREQMPTRDISDCSVIETHRRDTVRWVLEAPARLNNLIQSGKLVEAHRLWSEVEPLLQNWQGVKGAQDLHQKCLAIMEGAP